MQNQNLTAEEKRLLDDLLSDGENFEYLVIYPPELPTARKLADKKRIILHEGYIETTASAYVSPFQKHLNFIESLDVPIADELSPAEKSQILEKLKTKFGLD
jgi:hypothetical protein